MKRLIKYAAVLFLLTSIFVLGVYFFTGSAFTQNLLGIELGAISSISWNEQTSLYINSLFNLFTPEPPLEPQMPAKTHKFLALHAAESYGHTGVEKQWIAQGAEDEDNCFPRPYPPCIRLLGPVGYHAWDPDTNGNWEMIIIPSGPGLMHMNLLFDEAVDAYLNGDLQVAYLWLGRAVHILGDAATPAHTNLDEHIFGDDYEEWLDANDFDNTKSWITQHPSGSEWYLDYRLLPEWEDLGVDLQSALDDASSQYGGRGSGEELWENGPQGIDAVLFRLLFLMAEQSDDWDSRDVLGEKHHGNPRDPEYLKQIRNTLFPHLTRYTSALIDYFEYSVASSAVKAQMP
jgi:hypothetical protein